MASGGKKLKFKEKLLSSISHRLFCKKKPAVNDTSIPPASIGSRDSLDTGFLPVSFEQAEIKQTFLDDYANRSIGPYMLSGGAVKLFSTTGQSCPNFGR